MNAPARALFGSCLFVLILGLAANNGEGLTQAGAFQAELDSLRHEYGFPGATAAYVLADGTGGEAATGFADRETATVMTPRSRLLSASIGKTYLAAVAVALADEGWLNLDLPVSFWLGDQLWFQRLPNHSEITMRHLLTHSSGLADHVYSERFIAEVAHRWREPDNPFPPLALIDYSLDTLPLFAAGRGWAYSDSGYILAGLVIEAATGRDCFQEVTERFLVPLGLTETSRANRRDLPGLAAGYLAADNPFGFPEKTTAENGELLWHPGLEWTGGGWLSTSRDLARWGAALFGGRVLPEEALAEMLRAVPISLESDAIEYGAGVAISRNGLHGPVYGHGGWIPGYTSSLRYYPDHGVTVALQINTDIGIVDGGSEVIAAIERRLAEVAIAIAEKSVAQIGQ